MVLNPLRSEIFLTPKRSPVVDMEDRRMAARIYTGILAKGLILCHHQPDCEIYQQSESIECCLLNDQGGHSSHS